MLFCISGTLFLISNETFINTVYIFSCCFEILAYILFLFNAAAPVCNYFVSLLRIWFISNAVVAETKPIVLSHSQRLLLTLITFHALSYVLYCT